MGDKGKHRPDGQWLGGKHRDRGCVGAALLIVGTAVGLLAGATAGTIALVEAIF